MAETSYGWAGWIARVNLTSGDITEESDVEMQKDYIGGMGFANKIMYCLLYTSRIGGGAVFALAQDDDGGHRSRGHDDAFDIDANHANLQMCTASCGR